MGSRCLLHKSKLADFQVYLDGREIEYRPGRGEYEVLQVRDRSGPGWLCVWDRSPPNGKEHYTTDRRLELLVRQFINEGVRHG